MRRLRLLPGRSSLLAALVMGCGPAPSAAPKNPPEYGEFRNPFPAEAVAPADTAPPTAPVEPAKPAAPAVPSKHCGQACGACSRACETCDEEIRTTGQWDGPQCKRKEAICSPLLALQKATGCTCD